jgi:hypothetical protein
MKMRTITIVEIIYSQDHDLLPSKAAIKKIIVTIVSEINTDYKQEHS